MRLRRNDFFLDVEAQIDNDKGVHSRIGRVYGCKDGSVREDTLAPLCVGKSSPPAPHTAPRACLGPLPRSSPVAVSVDSLGSNLNLDFTCFVFTFWFQTWDRMWDRIPTELRDRNGDRMRLTNRGPKPWTELCDRNRDRVGAELCDRNCVAPNW